MSLVTRGDGCRPSLIFQIEPIKKLLSLVFIHNIARTKNSEPTITSQTIKASKILSSRPSELECRHREYKYDSCKVKNRESDNVTLYFSRANLKIVSSLHYCESLSSWRWLDLPTCKLSCFNLDKVWSGKIKCSASRAASRTRLVNPCLSPCGSPNSISFPARFQTHLTDFLSDEFVEITV